MAYDEFGQSLIESIWIKHAEIPPTQTSALESFKTTLKPILSQLIEKAVISVDDCHLLLDADLLLNSRLTRLD
jgi:hypothetical protein